jgi:hypothetical protein
MTGSERPERPERPGPGASEAELAEWRAKDFGWALLTGPDYVREEPDE